jgi:AcrR family transcriptional regulator
VALHQDTAQEVDPRVERSRDLVLTAAVDLLREVGYGPLTIEAVAARSGVAKSTVYRHWSGKLDLVVDAFERLRPDDDTPPEPGPVRGRVIALLQRLTVAMKDPKWRGSCLPALVEGAEHCPEVAAVSSRLAEKRSEPLRKVLDQGVAAGELPAGTDSVVLADALFGPILLRRLFHRPDLEPGEVPALVDQVLPRP